MCKISLVWEESPNESVLCKACQYTISLGPCSYTEIVGPEKTQILACFTQWDLKNVFTKYKICWNIYLGTALKGKILREKSM